MHLIGLVSDGGVHSSDRHLKALIDIAAKAGVEDLVIHAFTDGRDTSPHGGAPMLATVQEWMDEAGVGRIGSVVGRYFAMDRDTRWDRTEKAVKLLMEGEAEHEAESGEAAAKAAYERDETDEFITTTKVGDEDSTIRPGDSVFAFNFRPDRMRQITEALTKAGVDRYATLTEYEEGWPYPVAFPPARPDMTLAKLIAERGETQLHVAGDREVPARDVLLQRRRGGAVRGRGARARRLPARRPDLRPQARDERARGRRRVHAPLGRGRARCSGSSTSPTPTWSATPA